MPFAALPDITLSRTTTWEPAPDVRMPSISRPSTLFSRCTRSRTRLALVLGFWGSMRMPPVRLELPLLKMIVSDTNNWLLLLAGRYAIPQLLAPWKFRMTQFGMCTAEAELTKIPDEA